MFSWNREASKALQWSVGVATLCRTGISGLNQGRLGTLQR